VCEVPKNDMLGLVNMGAVKNKVHELVDSLTDDQAERVLEVLEEPTFFADEGPSGGLSEGDAGFWEEIERRADRARSGAEPGTPWETVFARLRARYTAT
jgi:hypothetical protein